MLKQWAPDVWTFDRPRKFAGFVEVVTRATVLRIGSDLLVHSPIRWGEDLRAALSPLGNVRWLLAPNKVHHLALGDWMAAYPQAALYGPPGLAKKRADLKFTAEVTAALPEWTGVRLRMIEGTPRLNELAVLHQPSRTLVLTDFLHNFGPEHNFFARLFGRYIGAHGKWAAPREGRMAKVYDRPAFLRSLEEIAGWEFERIIINHGRVCEENAREVLKQAFAQYR